MKLAVLSESPADEAAVLMLAAGVLQQPLTRVHASLRARGWPNVLQVMPAIARHLHFHTDADALVVVVDSDDSVVHQIDHERDGAFHPHCRLCRLTAAFRQATKKLPPARGRSRILRGIGVAVPAIEAWYLSGRDAAVTESAWVQGQANGRLPYTRADLKFRVYGTDRPTLALETKCALREVKRILPDTRRLEHDHPGFASLARDLRSWRNELVDISTNR